MSFMLLLFCTYSTTVFSTWPWESKTATLCNSSDVKCFGAKLYHLYHEEIEPIEEATLFHDLVLPPLPESHFVNTKPIVSIVGQYSSGKTTFVNLLIGKAYSRPSIAASTADFTFITGLNGNSDTCSLTETPDNSDGKYFVMNSNTPFNVYQYFSGTEVIKDVKAAFVQSEFLQDAYIIDSPGILTGNKDSCNFIQFYNTLYFQSDLIIFLFDPYKPSDLENAKNIFLLLKHSINKVRFVINKADSLSYRSLLDVYGAVQYNLGKMRIFESLETNKFYITSLWNKSCESNHTALCQIVEEDKMALFKEINQLKNPRFKIESKIKSLSERIQLIKRNNKNIERYATYQCRCGYYITIPPGYMSCKCSKEQKMENTCEGEQLSKEEMCYKKERDQRFEDFEKKKLHSNITSMQDLRNKYGQKLDAAQHKLNAIAAALDPVATPDKND